VLVSFWSPKGGCGTSVFAAACALVAARHGPTLLADLDGDQPAILGIAADPGAGLFDWLALGTEASPSALDRIALDAAPSLTLLPAGSRRPASDAGSDAGCALADALAARSTTCLIDLGRADSPAAVAIGERAALTIAAIRPCYLAFRRATRHPLLVATKGAVMFDEPGRVLSAHDLRSVLGWRVLAQIHPRPAAATTVDAGLLASRIPEPLARAARRVLESFGDNDGWRAA